MKENKCMKILCMLIATLFIVISLVCVSCEQEEQGEVITEPTNEGKRLAALQPVTDCDELA